MFSYTACDHRTLVSSPEMLQFRSNPPAAQGNIFYAQEFARWLGDNILSAPVRPAMLSTRVGPCMRRLTLTFARPRRQQAHKKHRRTEQCMTSSLHHAAPRFSIPHKDTVGWFLLSLALHPVQMGPITTLYGGTSPEVENLNGESHVRWVWVGTPRGDDPAAGKEPWTWLEEQVTSLEYLATIRTKANLGISIELAKCTRPRRGVS